MTPKVEDLALPMRCLSTTQRHVRFAKIRRHYGHDVAERVRRFLEARNRA